MPPTASRPNETSTDSYTLPRMMVTNRSFSVPLDHHRPEGEQITVFAREVVARGSRGAG